MPDILIIGGVAAGLSAASRARRVAPHARITVLERGPVASYGACGLPYVLSGRIQGLERLRVHSQDYFQEKRRIEVLTTHDVLEIEPARHRVRAQTPAGEKSFAYDHLVIATGATSRWQPSGPPARNIFSANTWEQVHHLQAALAADPSLRRMAVVGGGYIGLEMAAALAARGLQIVLLEAHPHLLHGFDPELASALPAALSAAGVELHLGTRVLGLEGAPGGRVLAVATSGGSIAVDAVLNCGGLRPQTTLAAAAGIHLGAHAAIAVDDHQRTSVSAIYAAGDCATTRHLVTAAPVWIPLGAAANKQGRVAGQNAAGGLPARFPGVLGTLAVRIFGSDWGRTGLDLEQARAAGFAPATVQITTPVGAAYLDPPALTLKLVFDRARHRLLGCHLRGAPGTVTATLDAAAVAISAAMTLEQIETLDLAYSPPLAPLYAPLLLAAHRGLAG